MVNYGKEWEKRFAAQWRTAFPTFLLERIHDQVSGFKTVSQNVADYYAFVCQKLVYLECKETQEGTLNFAYFPQLDRLLTQMQYKDVLGFVVIWFRKHKKVIMVSALEADKIRKDGHASIALSMCSKKLYNIIEIPSTTTNVYPKCDFSIMNGVINEWKA